MQDLDQEMRDLVLPDFLTCGHCFAHFRLDQIVHFIQHKTVHIRTRVENHQITEPASTSISGSQDKNQEEQDKPDNSQDIDNVLATPRNRTKSRKRTRTRSKIAPEEKIPEVSPSEIECSMCGANCPSSDALIQHLENTHSLAISTNYPSTPSSSFSR